MSENILEMKKINKSFPGVRALSDVDFSVKQGEVHCLIGANGAGKSTLMKILAGAYTKDSGEIIFQGKHLDVANTLVMRNSGISVIYQELSLVNDLSVAENIFINNFPRKAGKIQWKEIYRKAEGLADELNLKINVKSKISDLSIGERQLVELMKCLACKSKLIVMDEPSATLSSDEFETLIKTIKDLKSKGITIIYISHRLEELFIVGDRISILRDGQNVATVNSQDINIDQLVEYMIGYKIENRVGGIEEYHTDNETVLEIKNLNTKKLKNVSLTLHKGEIVGLYGLVGSGRTEILRAIYGVDEIDSGEVILNGEKIILTHPRQAIKKSIGMLPENRKTQGLVLGLPVWQNMTMVSLKKFISGCFIKYRGLFKECKSYVTDLRIKTPSIKTVTNSLSGGNQQKVILAKWLSQNSDILLVDEPTQGIDVGAKAEIYNILKRMSREGHSIIVASSELSELLQVCEKIIVMFHGQVVGIFGGNEMKEDAILQSAIAGR